MKQRILSSVIALVMLLSLCACGKEDAPPPDNTTPVEIAMVSKGSISAENNVSGQVTAGEYESVFVALSVRCTEVYVEAGAHVQAGQAICKLDTTSTWANYDTAVMSHQSAVDSYKDQSTLLAEQVAMAEKNVRDTEELFAIGAASQLEVDSARLQADSARVNMNSALAQLEMGIKNAQATLAQLESSLKNIDRNGIVTAPISGNIMALNAMKNCYVSPSAPLVTVDAVANRKIYAGVSESLMPKLTVGGKVKVTIASANRTFDASITQLDRTANQQTRLYGVTIQIPAEYTEGLLAGMFADVIFYTDTQTNVVVVPTEAVQTGMEGQYVYTVDSENMAHRIPVQTGLVGDGVTEVTAGLAGGEKLVTVGQFYLSEGAAVRIVSAEV